MLKKDFSCGIISNMIDLQDIWQDALIELVKNPSINAVAYSIWIENLKPVCLKNNALVLLAPSQNAKDTVNKSFFHILRTALESKTYHIQHRCYHK